MMMIMMIMLVVMMMVVIIMMMLIMMVVVVMMMMMVMMMMNRYADNDNYDRERLFQILSSQFITVKWLVLEIYAHNQYN